ncbi:MAG: hypothetical protein MJD61_07005, partial [Proteobacteria bacterium]|nr:hypothetical protein [Pseudomonadota bacterium]
MSDKNSRAAGQVARITSSVGFPTVLALLLGACSQAARPCLADADCQTGVCRASLDEGVSEDLAPLPLGCGSRGGGSAALERCETEGDCARGICLISGVCAAPCQSRQDCAERERCREVFARRGAAKLQWLNACAPIATHAMAVASDEHLLPNALSGSVDGDVVVLPESAPTT